MSYTKITTGFKDHETVLTAAHLQHMENGIADNDAALVNRVRTDTNVQGLSTSQKRNARTNIDAPSTAEMTAAVAAEADLRSAADAVLETKADSIQEEVDQAKEDISDLQAVSSSMVKTKTVSGNPITIKDALAGKAKKVTITLEPKRGLHGYNHPWVGGGGKNLLPPLATGGRWNGVDLSNGENGAIIAEGTATGAGGRSQPKFMTIPFTLKAGTYTTSCTAQSSSLLQIVVQRYSDNTVISAGQGVPFTLSADTEVVVGYNITKDVVYDNTPQYFQLEVGSTVTAYEPYSNICPIEGYDIVRITATGKNLLDNTKCVNRTISGITRTVQQDKSIILDGVSTSSSQWYLSVDTPFLTLPPGTYTVSCEVSFRLQSTKNGLNQYTPSFTNGSATFTINEITTFNNARFDIGIGTTANNLVVHPQLECGSTATEYEPFGSTTSLTLSQAAGATVYGGTVTMNEDGSGTLVVDRQVVSCDGTENWEMFNTDNRIFQLTTVQGNDTTKNGRNICSIMPDYYAGPNDSPAYFTVTKNSLRVTQTECDSAAAMKAWLSANPCEFVIFKESISTFNLTATQLRTLTGENHVWTDGTKLELTYRADKYADGDKFLNAIPTGTKTGDPAVFADGADDLPLERLEVAIEPKQDLHGYDRPWVGGRKNKLDVEKLLIGGSWSGNTYSVQAISSRPKVILSSEPSNFKLSYSAASFSGTNVRIETYNGDTLVGSHYFATSGASAIALSGITAIQLNYGNNGAFSITEPMIYLATETDVSYEPYSNICTIDGWEEVKVTRCGKNLFDKTTATAGKCVDGTGKVISKDWGYLSDYISVKPGATYHMVHGVGSGALTGGEYYDLNKGYKSGLSVSGTSDAEYTIIVPSDCYWVRINVKNTNLDLAQFEAGSTATAYEPYVAPTTLPISLKYATGSTVYGGTVTINRDGTGTVVVDRTMKTLSASDMTSLSDSGASTQMCIVSAAGAPSYMTKSDGVISSHFKPVAWGGNPWNVNLSISPYTANNVRIKHTGMSTLQDYKNFVTNNSVQILYPLATPISYILTAPQLTTLLGNNTIWCNAGEVSIVYHADTSLLIKKLVNALTAYGITV